MPFASKAKFLGTSQGSWYDIGTHIGKECEAMIAASTDYWWMQMCQKKGRTATQHAMEAYLSQVDALDPTQIELLKGIADGASAALGDAQCGDKEAPFTLWRLTGWSLPESLMSGFGETRTPIGEMSRPGVLLMAI